MVIVKETLHKSELAPLLQHGTADMVKIAQQTIMQQSTMSFEELTISTLITLISLVMIRFVYNLIQKARNELN